MYTPKMTLHENNVLGIVLRADEQTARSERQRERERRWLSKRERHSHPINVGTREKKI